MRVVKILPILLAPAIGAVNIVLSNDDGWAAKNIRVLYDALVASGQNVLISAPALDKSGTGSSDADPTPLGSSGCEYSSCPANAPAIGSNATEPRFNYVNAFPATSMRYGIQNLSQPILGGPPDLAVSGFNVGANSGSTVAISGTVGAACEAVKQGVPAIAFSGTTGTQVGWNTATETYQTVYADLSSNLTNAIIKAGKPYLPDGIWLNVNYPAVSNSNSPCALASKFTFVLTKIRASLLKDVDTCGGTTLPTEATVLNSQLCYATVTVAYAANKSDADAASQMVVLDKLGGLLGCFSNSTTTPSTSSGSAKPTGSAGIAAHEPANIKTLIGSTTGIMALWHFLF